jgi:hypothetical protein
MVARDSFFLRVSIGSDADSGATLASPQSDRSSELDRRVAVWRRLRVDRVDATRSASPGICAIISLYGERAATAHSISNPSGLCDAAGRLRSHVHEYSAS